jgi:small subunit ribosomal protein S1
VLSRRDLLEAERDVAQEKLKGQLEVEAVVTGRVSRLVDFGVFVDLGGMDGLIPMRELAWKRVESASDVVSEGDKVEVKILSVDWDRGRISLSLRQAAGDPWEGVGERYHVTKRYHGTVARLMDFGAFVELEPGVEGLVHISRLGDGKRLSHADEVLSEGEELDVYVEGLDTERRRISLRLDNPQLGRTMDVEGDQITVGGEMVGPVEDIRHFGVFVRLTPSHTGLLHVSEIDLPEVGNRVRMMQRQFQPNAEVTVLVKSVHQNKISLALPGKANEDDEEDFSHLMGGSEGNGLGSLGSVFSGLDL